jgi:hypothetical protein
VHSLLQDTVVSIEAMGLVKCGWMLEADATVVWLNLAGVILDATADATRVMKERLFF